MASGVMARCSGIEVCFQRTFRGYGIGRVVERNIEADGAILQKLVEVSDGPRLGLGTNTCGLTYRNW